MSFPARVPVDLDLNRMLRFILKVIDFVFTAHDDALSENLREASNGYGVVPGKCSYISHSFV